LKGRTNLKIKFVRGWQDKTLADKEVKENPLRFAFSFLSCKQK